MEYSSRIINRIKSFYYHPKLLFSYQYSTIEVKLPDWYFGTNQTSAIFAKAVVYPINWRERDSPASLFSLSSSPSSFVFHKNYGHHHRIKIVCHLLLQGWEDVRARVKI